MVIRARAVRRTYGDVVALDGVSLDVADGEVYALVGPNGAGKTTLVRALCGTTAATGELTVLGGPPDAVDPQRIGLLPQSFAPPGRLTARELIRYYGGLYERARDADAVLGDVGIADRDVRYEHLSGGQQRRVCVAIALVNEPDLLILDEPTTGIDPAGRRAVTDLLDALAAAGTTVFLTTHDMGVAERLADRVGLLAAGSLVAEGTPADLIAAHGGASRLVIDGGAAVAAALREAGYGVAEADRSVTVTGLDAADIGAIVETLESADVDYDAVTWRQPDLEDVYLALAGGAETARPTGDRGHTDGAFGQGVDS